MIDDEINIIYEPSYSLFDHILCSCMEDINYYLFSNNQYSLFQNCYSLPASHADLYSYDIYISNEIINLINSKNTITQIFHVTDLIFQHKYKPPQIKKEDLLLIHQKIKNKSKIFFDQNVVSSWGFENAQIVPYGIPLDVFTNNVNDRNPSILILSHNNMASQQIHNHFLPRNIKCETINNFNELNIQDINNKFNEYKIVLDLQNHTINQLCALACGCDVLTLSNQPESLPLISSHTSINHLVAYCDTILDKKDKAEHYEETQKYLDNNFNYEKFKASISEVMEFNKRKAFIL